MKNKEEDPVLRETREFPVVNRPEFKKKEVPVTLNWHCIKDDLPPKEIVVLIWRKCLTISEGIFPSRMAYTPTHWALKPNTPED